MSKVVSQNGQVRGEITPRRLPKWTTEGGTTPIKAYKKESTSNIRQKGGYTKTQPPTLSKLSVGNPPLCLNYPPNCLTNNRDKLKPKLYKLNYKSEKPFLIKAFLLWVILELAPRATPRATNQRF